MAGSGRAGARLVSFVFASFQFASCRFVYPSFYRFVSFGFHDNAVRALAPRGEMEHRKIDYVPALYKIFDEILVHRTL